MKSVATLCFHRVVEKVAHADLPYLARGTAITQQRFAAILADYGRTHEFIDESRLFESSDRPRCWVTFDDGYADVHSYAAPVLAEYRIRPTLFLTTRALTRGWAFPVDRWYAALSAATVRRVWLDGFHVPRRWVDLDHEEDHASLVDGPEKRQFLNAPPVQQRQMLALLRKTLRSENLAPPSLLSEREVRALAQAGWRVGAHGASHRLLHACSPEVLRREVAGSVHALKAFGTARSRWFAWPDGAWSVASVNWLAARKKSLRLLGSVGLTLAHGLASVDMPEWGRLVPR